MRYSLLGIFLIVFLGSFTDTERIIKSRQLYEFAKEYQDSATELFTLTEGKTNSTLKAYHGASLAFKAKHHGNPIKKLEYLKQGLKIINEAVLSDVINIEIRFIRYTIEDNIPSFVQFTNHTAADKKMIENVSSSHPLYDKIKAYLAL